MLFETDYPHPICLYGAEVREKIDAAFVDLAKDVRDKVLFENAAELYGVEAPEHPWEGGAGTSSKSARVDASRRPGRSSGMLLEDHDRDLSRGLLFVTAA